MSQKFIAVFLLLFVTPTLIIVLISYKNYSASIEKTTTAYVSQISDEMMNKLNEYITDMKKTTLTPYYIPDMQSELQIKKNSLNKIQSINDYIQLMNRDWNSRNLIYIFDSFGNVFYNMKIDDVRNDISKKYSEFKEIAYAANGNPVVLGTKKATDMKGRTRYFLTVVRSIKDTSNYKQVGITVVDVDIDVLDGTVNKLDSITNGKTIIIDQSDYLIYDSSNQFVAQRYSDSEILNKAKDSKGSFKIERNGKVNLCVYSVFPDTGWKLFVTIPVETLFHDAVANSRLIALVTLATGALAIFFFIFLSYSITKPLRKLALLMKKVQEGDMEVQFHVKYNDEVGMVATSFNHMVRRLKELIEEVYITNLRKKQTELDALQGQINPHFIYNTLETIRMIAVIHRVDELSEFTIAFGKLLRYSVNHVNEIVTIEDELKHLESYVYLQNKRFSNKFSLNINIQNSLMDMKTIKLIFQPIVENAILHGLEREKKPGYITIFSEQTDEMVFFKISDNGSGIDSERLKEVNQSIELDSLSLHTKCIGLRNVNERIKLYYGENFGLAIESKLGVGTVVTLKLPRMR
jgi:two-component system sensor histidine kinase YesM